MLLEKNRELKSERKKLDGMQDIIESIEISDGHGNTCCKLMSFGFTPDEGWSAPLPSESKCIDLNNLHELQLSVSGECLRKAAGSFSPPYAFNETFGQQFYHMH